MKVIHGRSHHAISQCREYNILLCVAFVDYQKAFDSVKPQVILTSLQEQGIEDVYMGNAERHIHGSLETYSNLHKESDIIRIKRGVRQGDTTSPKLFTATLESIFRRLNLENKGVKIDGGFLSIYDLLMIYVMPRNTTSVITDGTKTIRWK